MSYITLPNPSAPIIGLDGNSWEASSVFRLKDNVTVHIGNDFSISAKALKACLKTMLPAAIEQYPEDFL